MSFQAKSINQSPLPFPSGKVVCVGRNYAAHAKELGNEVPKEPLLFIKPATSLCHLEDPVKLPAHLTQSSVHFETEIALVLGADLTRADVQEAQAAIWGYGIALDLTLRDLQNQLKSEGKPWEKAKAFDGACPVSVFVPRENISVETLQVNSFLNGQCVQKAKPENMLWPMAELLAYMSQYFTLQKGDIILTGTPEGVGEIKTGDTFSFELLSEEEALLSFSTDVV